jgi:hypothetical protein
MGLLAERSELSERERGKIYRMLLTILIPTYNRANDLFYNLQLLENIIIKTNLKNKIAIIKKL